MSLLHRPWTWLAIVTLVAAVLTGAVSGQQSANAQLPPVELPGLPGSQDPSQPPPGQNPQPPAAKPVPTLPDTSKLAHSWALRDCQPDSQTSIYGVPGVDPRGADPHSANPLQGLTFFVDPTEPAWLKYRSLKRRGMQRDADLMWKIASTPRARWFGRFTRPRMKR